MLTAVESKLTGSEYEGAMKVQGPEALPSSSRKKKKQGAMLVEHSHAKVLRTLREKVLNGEIPVSHN